VDSGVRLALGFDAPVETLDVLAGVYAAVTRTRRVADFVALSRDSLTVPPEELPEIMVIMTVIDGTVPLCCVVGLGRLQLVFAVQRRCIRFVIVVRFVVRHPVFHLKSTIGALVDDDFSLVVGCQELHVRFTLRTGLCQRNRHGLRLVPVSFVSAGDLCHT
jgi:hypothetical protein